MSPDAVTGRPITVLVADDEPLARRRLLRLLRAEPGIEIVAEPQLSVVAFRLVREGADLNALNGALIERINARKRVMVTPTVLAGQFVIRICVVSFRTHMDRMRMCMEDIRAAVGEV